MLLHEVCILVFRVLPSVMKRCAHHDIYFSPSFQMWFLNNAVLCLCLCVSVCLPSLLFPLI